MTNLPVEINLPYNLVEIEEDGFRDNLLTNVVLPGKLEVVGFRAFMDNLMESILIPSSVVKFALCPATDQGGHFNNTPLVTVYADAGNLSSLPAFPTEEVMGAITASTTTLRDTVDATLQQNNSVANSIWE